MVTLSYFFCGEGILFLIISLLDEVPGSARVNLQPVEHLLFCKQFSKMFPSAFSILGPGGRGQESNLNQNLPWTVRDKYAKFHQDWYWGLDFH